MKLDREEYIEQAYLFRAMRERALQNQAAQDVLVSIREEILVTTRLPLAVDFMASELKLHGVLSSAMEKLAHYFAPFQAFVVAEAERERGRFDMLLALEILEREARFRADAAQPQGLFVYQFESLCRNRLGYDRGLKSMADDPWYDEAWRAWILIVRRQVGLVDLADMIYVRSQHYLEQAERRAGEPQPPEAPVLFGAKEGRIALANRQKDPLLLFAALHRQLGYPEVPRPRVVAETTDLVPQLARRLDRLEARLKLLQDEQHGGIDLSKFYGPESRDRWPADE